MFMGRKVRGLRRHYAYLRRVLGEKKLLHKIKEIGDTEQRKINDILHKISHQIVDMAKENNAVILLGDLSGIRNRQEAGVSTG
jgi:putative transposase